MPRNDKVIPKQTEKLIYQEASSRCSFCPEDHIPLLDIHHIVPRADGGSNDPSNLILVCKNCHARIDSGAISSDEVSRVKHTQRVIPLIPRGKTSSGNNLTIGGDVTSSIIANSLTITGDVKLPRRMSHPAGSIGANLNKKNYIAHLVEQYHTLRSADGSYGRTVQYEYAVLYKSIERKFKAKTYFIPESRFEDLVQYLQNRIDATIQGKRNRKNGYKNYSDFYEYIRDHGDPTS
jgi:HNH endonuclease